MTKDELGVKYLLHPANKVVRKTEFKPRFPGFVAQKEAQKEYLRLKDINSGLIQSCTSNEHKIGG